MLEDSQKINAIAWEAKRRNLSYGVFSAMLTEENKQQSVYQKNTRAIQIFENGKYQINLRLLNTQSYNGMTDLIYTRR